ncbi:hypothetical protein JKF63_02525 [Porcisia hertigi]|uniref:Uncharacterized protein n=1 Tax=Porcisia hertigi TaxID=2761500 RepID=A0A836HRD3_9TRYP|nr:hypothetical protein JKF63_02525 [Porcisia hertigi]
MALFLDDEEVHIPARTSFPLCTPQPPMTQPHAPGDVDHIDAIKQRNSTCVTTPLSRAAASVSSTAAAAQYEERSPLSAGAAVTLPLRGGNGMEKMDALLFGKARVAFIRDNSLAGHKRSADDASGARMARTPVTPKRSSHQVCDSSTGGTGTQPKVVSAARSPSLSTLHPERTSTASLDTTIPTSDERPLPEVVSTSPECQRGSLSASPPARPPPNSPAVREGAVESRTTTTQPVKTQTKLSDFFSKMACKR